MQVFVESPRTDSNRRLPPYHSAPWREATASVGHLGHESPANGRDRASRINRACPRVPALASSVFPWQRPRFGLAGFLIQRPASDEAAGDPLLTMEVLGRYWRARPGIRDHVSPANHVFATCLQCPRVPGLAYPFRTRGSLSVLETHNEDAPDSRGPASADSCAQGTRTYEARGTGLEPATAGVTRQVRHKCVDLRRRDMVADSRDRLDVCG